jgi:hypothetical protein
MNSSILIKNIEKSNTIYLDPHEIVFDNNVIYGRIFLKVKSKKIFTKWSERIFFYSKKKFTFWKMKNKKRKKCKSIYFKIFFSLGGFHNNYDKDGDHCYIFSLKSKKKVYTFKSYNYRFFDLYKNIDDNHDKEYIERYRD